jgi:peptidoglycan/LPS O-acetylase OafA/YrhL
VSRPATAGFLPEVQALRAIAVTLVILFHLWPGRVTGGYVGVDVFFVISGFLISAHLLREVDSTGTIRLTAFWARRIRRLLPAAMLVLAVTLAAVLVFLPEPAWQRTMQEIGASALYLQNWLLASNAVDYFASEDAATAVQHYWSLSVEEQFYLVWPLLMIGAAALGRWRNWSVRRTVTVIVAAIGALSFAYSVWFSAESPSAAYFSTFTHVWEFAAGALLGAGLAVRWSTTRRWVAHARALLSWAGFALIIGSGLVFTGATVFPGYLALIPVVGVLAIILAGDSSGSILSPMPLARLRPVQFVGDVSYSAYLWHWPFIVIVPYLLDRELGTLDRVGILVATFALAAVTKRWVEDAARTSPRFTARPRLAFGFALVGALVLVVGTAVPYTLVEQRTEQAAEVADAILEDVAQGEVDCFGAAAMLSGDDCSDRFVVDERLLLAASEEIDQPGGQKIVLDDKLTVTVRGNPDGERTVALVGDSHANHYAPALLDIAAEHGWRVLVVRYNNCSPSATGWFSDQGSDMEEGCQRWRRNLMEVLPAQDDIDVIVTSSIAPRYAGEGEETKREVAQAFTDMWSAWTTAGKKVVVIADVPGAGRDIGEVSECVAANPGVVDPCSSPRSSVIESDAMIVAATERPLDGLELLDFTPAYCDDDTCHVVVGGLIVYYGGAHLSAPFSRSLIPYLEPALVEAMR